MSAPEDEKFAPVIGARVAGPTIRIGYQGEDRFGNLLVEPEVFVEQNGERIVLSRSMVDLIAYHQRRTSECVVNADGTVALPEGFQEGKRAAINAKPVYLGDGPMTDGPLPIDEELAP